MIERPSERPAVAARPRLGRHRQSGYRLSGVCGCQIIAGAATAGRAADEDAAAYQIAYVLVCRILGKVVYPRPFRLPELPLGAVQQPIQNLHLVFVEHFVGMGFPEVGVGQDRGKGVLGTLARAPEAFETVASDV